MYLGFPTEQLEGWLQLEGLAGEVVREPTCAECSSIHMLVATWYTIPSIGAKCSQYRELSVQKRPANVLFNSQTLCAFCCVPEILRDALLIGFFISLI